MATTNPLADQLYPFSTEDGQTIPLDIIRPVGLVTKSFPGSGAPGTLTIPTNWLVASFYSEVGCIIQFNAATLPAIPVDNVEYVNTLLVPPGCIVVATVIPGPALVVPYGTKAGNVFAQRIQKWAGIALRRQVNRT